MRIRGIHLLNDDAFCVCKHLNELCVNARMRLLSIATIKQLKLRSKSWIVNVMQKNFGGTFLFCFCRVCVCEFVLVSRCVCICLHLWISFCIIWFNSNLKNAFGIFTLDFCSFLSVNIRYVLNIDLCLMFFLSLAFR